MLPELDQPVPRRVTFSTAFKVLIGISALTFFFLLSAFLGPAFLDSHRIEVLQARGVTADAEIVDLSYFRAPGISRTPRYYVLYKFYDPRLDYPWSKGEAYTSLDAYDNLQIGEKIRIIYDPENSILPELNIAADSLLLRRRADIESIIRDFIIISSIYAVLLVGPFLQYRYERRLVRLGAAVSATIVGAKEYVIKVTPFTAVSYSFADSAGKMVYGVRRGIRSKARWNEGPSELLKKISDQPTVIYDPADSSRNILYPPFIITAKARAER